jgi:hypothetical protein
LVLCVWRSRKDCISRSNILGLGLDDRGADGAPVSTRERREAGARGGLGRSVFGGLGASGGRLAPKTLCNHFWALL